MHQKTVGTILSEERQKRRISTADFAKRARIRESYILALESDHFDELPPAVFVKGYVKMYARILGFDSAPVLALLRRDFKLSAVGTLVPREFLTPVLKRRSRSARVTLALLGLIIVFLTVSSYVFVQWYQVQQPPKLQITDPAENIVSSPSVVVRGKTDATALVTINNQPVALRPDGSFETTLEFFTEGVVSLVVEATDQQGKKTTKVRQVQVQF
ncbi:MAG: helix-turn-helix domain-containing protein [bacterium]|nr:helix-turn-helix domain-containing protein [bacterium]